MLSAVIPVWSGTQVMIDMHIKLCKSVRDQCDELIVCEDGPFNAEIESLCDIYLVHKERLGHAQNLQSGVGKAKGDFIGILDSDVTIMKGSLRSLCIPNKFVSGKCLNWAVNPDVFYIWCSVTDSKVLRQFPFPTVGEILDEWARTIPKELIVESELVEYEHAIGIGYTEWKSTQGE